MDLEREFHCINCPRSCMLHVSGENDVLEVTGNFCPRGKQYAISECTAPVRRFTGTVALRDGVLPVVSVKTETDIPKEKMLETAQAVRMLSAQAPVAIGDVLCENIAQTGVALIVTKNVGRYVKDEGKNIGVS